MASYTRGGKILVVYANCIHLLVDELQGIAKVFPEKTTRLSFVFSRGFIFQSLILAAYSAFTTMAKKLQKVSTTGEILFC